MSDWQLEYNKAIADAANAEILKRFAAERERDMLREALKGLENAYRDVEMAMPPEQGKAVVLAWMKARAALEAKP